MLSTQGLACSKHSRVISAFRECFVKPGLFVAEYGDICGRLMDHRHVGDCEVELLIEDQQAHSDMYDARRLVQRVERRLKQEGWLWRHSVHPTV